MLINNSNTSCLLCAYHVLSNFCLWFFFLLLFKPLSKELLLSYYITEDLKLRKPQWGGAWAGNRTSLWRWGPINATIPDQTVPISKRETLFLGEACRLTFSCRTKSSGVQLELCVLLRTDAPTLPSSPCPQKPYYEFKNVIRFLWHKTENK